MIRILLADDHAIFLQGLTHLIESLDGIDIVGQAMDGAEAWEKIQLLRPDVAVLDITMPAPRCFTWVGRNSTGCR